MCPEHFEEGLERLRLLQGLAELPDGVLVRHGVGEVEAQEALEGEAVEDLELGGLVGQLVEALEDEDPAEEQPGVGRPAAGPLAAAGGNTRSSTGWNIGQSMTPLSRSSGSPCRES
jgi:hypothetical protein